MSKKYDTFAAYLEDVYYNQIFSKIKLYIFNNNGRLDLSTSAVPDPSYVELSDFKIMGVNGLQDVTPQSYIVPVKSLAVHLMQQRIIIYRHLLGQPFFELGDLA